ncbi:MAG: hypothetical protein V3V33_07560 [Candidatus Lokiarchaeia archaeon]
MHSKILKFTALLLALVCFISFGTSLLSLDNFINNTTVDNSDFSSNYSPSNNFDNIQDILDSKLADYNSLGYFPQIYQPSLQATYYALYVLDKIGRLSEINITETSNFIMSYYDMISKVFSDDYSKRYLDINISKTYYPYTSLLEVNCYAILSLNILNKLNLVNTQDCINFIWSCYNPVTNGFIEQPYNYILPNYFKLSTMDNTFYAISTLDLLMGSWSGYQTEKNELIHYINSLVDITNILNMDKDENNNIKVNNIPKVSDAVVSKGYTPKMIADASMRHRVDDDIYAEMIEDKIIIQAPAAVKADEYILEVARVENCKFLTNDRFEEYWDEFGKDWIFNHRLTCLFFNGKFIIRNKVIR